MVPYALLVLLLCSGALGYVVQTSPDGYISYRPGTYPLIISAPHGGYQKPSIIPKRTNGCLISGACIYEHGCGTTSSQCGVKTLRDSYTRQIAEAIWSGVYDLTGEYPHLVINELHRSKMDANREINEATLGVPEAIDAFNNYTYFIGEAKNQIAALGDGNGLFFDIHGQTHSENWIELGYLISRYKLDNANTAVIPTYFASIRALQERECATNATCWWGMVNGDTSLGKAYLDVTNSTFDGIRIVPSTNTTSPNGGNYYSGGYNTKTFGSQTAGDVDAIQIEIPSSIRFGEKYQFASIMSQAAVNYMNTNQYITP